MSAAQAPELGEDVRVVGRVVWIAASGNGDRESGENLGRRAQVAIDQLRQHHDRIAVLFDATGLASAEESYARALGEIGREIGDRGVTYVIVVDRAWLRVLARTAAFIAGIDARFVPTIADGRNALVAAGFAGDLRGDGSGGGRP